MVSGLRSPIFFIILAIYLLAGALFATLTPNWQAPDEPAHYNYVHYLAAQGSFPQLVGSCYNQAYLEQLKAHRFPPELSITSICYEFHQPPLYYLLAAPVFLLSGGSLTALRLLSVVLGAGVSTFAFLVAQAIFQKSPTIAYGTMALVAFVPMHVAVLASVNNDALAELILAALLLLLTRRLMTSSQAAARSDVGLGVLLGLGLITKATVYIAVPLVAVTLWLAAREDGRVNWRGLARQAAIIYGLALLIAWPWYIRNATLYGNFDLLGLARHDEVVVGQLRTVDFLAEVGRRAYVREFMTTTFQSFWGQFGWMAVPMSGRVYLALTLVTLAALGGVIGFWISSVKCQVSSVRFWKSASSPDVSPFGKLRTGCFTLRQAQDRLFHPSAPPLVAGQVVSDSRQYLTLGLMALTIGLMALGYGWYNLEFVQFQGRYLFPALIPVGLFIALGLDQALSWQRRWWLAAGLAIALGWVAGAAWVSGNMNKLVLLLVGLALVLMVGRIWLARHWLIPATWLMGAIYTGLALLTLLSPFWYVIPYLSP